MIKLMFIIPLAYAIYASDIVPTVEYYDSVIGLVGLCVKEFMVGLSLSFAVYIIFTIMYLAGQFIDYQIGFSMVSVLDPVSQIQVPITGNMLNIMVLLIFLRSGALNTFIAAIFRSFEILPLGMGRILNNDFMHNYIIMLIVEYFVLGVQIAIPIIGTILIIDISLGLLVKAAPQMNVFVVGMPIKLLIGLILLYVVIPIYGSIYDFIYEQAMAAMLAVLEGLG
jgi:flagellar biosynthetic protein FliR